MALQQAEGGIAQSIVRKDARNCLEREGIYLMGTLDLSTMALCLSVCVLKAYTATGCSNVFFPHDDKVTLC